ncbi:hypothetical protein [Polaribacter porphyrae]|uniref:Uncharacterized protein n=1 Tax=Polaribacter porphyrae TaxID=1137780 RepID=A0A2S7WTX2_9FLAO|nr:hypothetical protein [Polaribacter porphyrae]PQJ80761.1 hypothetical protein BTO18_16985 [Polaribacter porphyrae]
MNIKNSILNFIGLFTIVFVITSIIRKINRKTETKIISENALKVISDKHKAEKIRESIEQYHKNNKWDETKINTYL